MATSQEGASAGDLAWKIMSGASDAVEFAAELGVKLPFIGPIFKAINAIREKAEKVRTNRKELIYLHERCSEITASFIVKCKTNSPGVDVVRLQSLIQDVDAFVADCQQNSRGSAIRKPAKVAGKIAGLHERINRMTNDTGLADIAAIVKMIIEMEKDMASIRDNTEATLKHRRPEQPPSPMLKLAKLPRGTPEKKPWHVERRRVMDTVFGALDRDGAPPLVGLVGGSGSGKTTAASEIIRSDEIRWFFADGIVWLTVNDGAKERLPLLMRQLARMVYEIDGGSVGRPPGQSEDGALYIKRFVEEGHNGKGFKCLVVADNVWEEEAVSKLLETGMSILVSTRHEELVTGAGGEAVGVGKLTEEDAKLLLRKAAELPEGACLPDAAEDLVELCGRVAMDLAFVGRWSTVRGTEARIAWSKAVEKIIAEMDSAIGRDRENEMAEYSHVTRREAILRAGFEDLAVGSGNARVQQLYLSLAVMPDDHEFTVKDAAVLLIDRPPSPDDETEEADVMEILERWSIVRSKEGTYQTLDAHSTFARERLMDHGYVRKPALERWVKHISSLESLGSFESYVLKDRLHEAEEAAEWRKKEIQVLPSALARMRLLADADDFERQEDPKGIYTLAYSRRGLGSDDRIAVEKLLRRCVKMFEAKLGSDHVDVANALRKLGRWLRDEGQLEEAEELLLRCLGIQETNGVDDVAVAYTLNELGVCVRETGQERLEDAVDYLRRALRIKEAKLGRDHVQVAYTLHHLGISLRRAGGLEEAESVLRRCLEIREVKLGPEDMQTARTLHKMGACIREAGRLDEAEELLRRSLRVKEAKLDPKIPDDLSLARTVHQLGMCIRDAGRLEEAEGYCRRCLGIVESKLGVDDEKVPNAVHVQLGERQVEWLERARNLLKQYLEIEEAKLDCKGADDILQKLPECLREARRTGAASVLEETGSKEGNGSRRTGAASDQEEAGSSEGNNPVLAERCSAWVPRLDEGEVYVSCEHGIRITVPEQPPDKRQQRSAGPILLERTAEVVKCGEEVVIITTIVHCFPSGATFDIPLLLDFALEDGATKNLQDKYKVVVRENQFDPWSVFDGIEHVSDSCSNFARARIEHFTQFSLGEATNEENTHGYSVLRGRRFDLKGRSRSFIRCKETSQRILVERLEDAVDYLRRALRIKEAKLGRDHVEVAYTLHHLGISLRRAGRLEEAESVLRRCLEIREAKLGPEDIQTTSTLHKMGACIREAGRLNEAEELLRRSLLQIKEAKLNPKNPDDLSLARTVHQLGMCIRDAGRLEEAEGYFRRCLGIVESKLGVDDGKLARMVYEFDGGSVGYSPGQTEDGAVYIKWFVEEGHNGKGFKYLVVADNVWDKDVVSKLLETGMSVLVSTRHEELVTGAGGEAVGVGKLSKIDAELLLSKAAALPEGACLPDAAEDLAELWAVWQWTWHLWAGGAPFEREKDAAVLLFDCTPTPDDETEEADVMEILERWSIVRSKEGTYQMLDAHSTFARERLMDHGYVHRLHEPEEAAEWRKQADEALPLALAKMRLLADADDFEQQEDSKGILNLNYHRRKLGSGDRIAVEKLLRRCVEIFEAKLGSDHADVANALRKLGRWLRHDRRLEEAEELLVRCLRIQETNLDVGDVVVAYTLNELGVCVRETGQERLGDATRFLRRALRIKEAKLGRDHVQVAYTLHHLGISLRRAGRLKEADRVLRRCLEIREAKLGPEDMQTARTLHKLGACIREAGRLNEAEELLRRSLRIKEAKLDPKIPGDFGLARTVHQLGMCIRDAGKLREAEGYFRRCLGIVESKLGGDDGKVPQGWDVPGAAWGSWS
eukprot:g13695.t1